MKPLVDIYKDSFFRRRSSLMWRVPIVCEPIFKEFNPTSIVDVGCGIGDYVMGFKGLGVLFAHGIEGSDNCLPHLVVNLKFITIADLRTQFDLQKSFDVAMSFEVAEHIEPEYADIFLLNLTNLSDRILITAAGPGQGGHYHVNCQPKSYWIDKFDLLGYDNIQERAESIKKFWEPWKHRKEIYGGYYNNLLYFERR